MGRELPDEICNFFIVHWEELGLNPVIVFRILERGLSHDEVDFALSTLIGRDWKTVKVTEWIDRLEQSGLITIPAVGDTPPISDLLADMIRTFNFNMCGYCNLGWLDEEKYGQEPDEFIIPVEPELMYS